jgi:hypothetical protein
LAARPELVTARRVRGEPRTRPLQPNLASSLSRERVDGRLALFLRRLVSRHMGLRLVLVRFRFLFFLISFLSLRHGDGAQSPDETGNTCPGIDESVIH